MIIDRAPLNGLGSYFRRSDGTINLGGPTAAIAKYEVRGEGNVTRIDGIELLIVGDDLAMMLSRSRHDAPVLVSTSLNKEVFPGLFVDPYSSRVHTVGGQQDLTRGKLRNARIMEVDSRPTLVSLGNDCQWRSAIYRFEDNISIQGAAWDLVPSRRTPEDAFAYSILVETWQSNDPAPNSNPDSQVLIADGLSPSDARAFSNIIGQSLGAYRIIFNAKVNYDPAFSVLSSPTGDDPSFGRPLLRSLSFLEPFPPTFEFHSLSEFMSACSDVSIYASTAGPLTHMTATMDIAATLADGESIELRVKAGAFKHLEARLIATKLERPPITDEAV